MPDAARTWFLWSRKDRSVADQDGATLADREHPAPGQDLRSELPPLYADTAFWGMTATQFFGAFNDNLFKQLMLLLAVPVGLASVQVKDQQGLATFVFSLPFVLFSGYAGFLADRYSKQPIMVLSKVAEIVVMALGMAAFLAYGSSGYWGLLLVLFLMGTQSAFFGPSKYGILPEMLRTEDLPRANGVIVMTTFLAIIFGTASAGFLNHLFVDRGAPLVESAHRLWVGSAVCIVIAVIGTVTSFLIRRVPAARPKLQFQASALTIPPESRRVLADDVPLLMAILASCVFWLGAGVAIQAVNSLGLRQLQLGDLRTSILTAVIGVGIACGALLAGRMCHGRADSRVVQRGAWGLFFCLLLISISLPDGKHLLGFWGTLPVLVLLGISAGLFAIPVQVFIQARPPDGLKGRMIAVMNQTNFFAIMISGLIYWLFDRIVEANGWPRSVTFAMIAALILPVAIFYRLPADQAPRSEAT
jgi:acyl-[acyl-carrier-protein]-phospholipid O-acyltransferase/long-chain-fatty-acid--[acyl-carrier-protein] ligase